MIETLNKTITDKFLTKKTQHSETEILYKTEYETISNSN